ncbi:hypothetical protein [Tautonia plasticadhaerens]|uniref:Uncharacterized protein n=1 Tax=Tautonia plasticadhaerens TaxID=2527974 RepID=A0A518HAD4_9BACT|nr:hypothetical protein [Tautonia plasticadhaerens]QDV37789.1 hypothetical protein ElP_57350 [Tautonia plasticadhaerens]
MSPPEPELEVETSSVEVATPIVYRTYRLSEDLRAAIRGRRSALDQTVRAFVAEAVDGELPALLEALAAAGLAGPTGPGLRPVRLPLSRRLLQSLREAAGRTGIPASHLLRACLGKAARRTRRRRAGAVQAVPAPAPQSPRDGEVMFYLVSLLVVGPPGDEGDPSLADLGPVSFRLVDVPGPRLAAARAYVAGVGRRRAVWLRQSGEPADRWRAEVDVAAIARGLAEVARWRAAPRHGPGVETWAYRLPPVAGVPGRGRGAVLLLVSKASGKPAAGGLLPRLLEPSRN